MLVLVSFFSSRRKTYPALSRMPAGTVPGSNATLVGSQRKGIVSKLLCREAKVILNLLTITFSFHIGLIGSTLLP